MHDTIEDMDIGNDKKMKKTEFSEKKGYIL